MASTTRSDFRNNALLSGLVSQDQLDVAEAAVRSAGTGASELTDEEVADKLVDMEVVTRYQANQILGGRNKLNLGPYTITDFIGQGGMGQVFKAVHNVMGRECAIKVLPVHKTTTETEANFRREIRTQAKLDHPNLVRAFDAGQDGKVHYLVTEYVPGTDLRRLIRSEGRLNMQMAANVVMQAALGLDHAHNAGLIHRDMKPGNILVTPEGVAKVSDLGLAGFINDKEDDPRAGKIVGTADYLSPEQIRNPHDVNRASDIYSLGCTLYYAITGKVPFPGGTPSSKARRHLEETPWHPRRFNPDVTEEFVEVIADMMEKQPEDRLTSAAEVAARLEPWASEELITSQRLTKSPWTAPPVPTDTDGEPEEIDSGEMDSRDNSASQLSHGTDPFSAATHETRRDVRIPAPPPLPPSRQPLSSAGISYTLAACVPIALAIGIWLGFILRGLM